MILKDTNPFDSEKVSLEIEAAMNKLGGDGWELQSVERGTVIFKREKQQ